MAKAQAELVINKLVAARTRLILEQPFLGALVLRLPLQMADSGWCATTDTDAKTLFFNSAYVESLSFDQLQFVLAGEALHCALSHFNRRGHRQSMRWNQACDYAVNMILLDEGLSAPDDALIRDEFRGLTAEEIYPLLHSDDEASESDGAPDNREQTTSPTAARLPQQPNAKARAQPQSPHPSSQQDHRNSDPMPPSPPISDGEVDQGSRPDGRSAQANGQPDPIQSQLRPAPQPPPLTDDEKNRLQQRWQQRLAGAAQQAQLAGKLGGDILRMIELFLQPTLPWRAVLAQYMNSIARNDYSYSRPSSRRGDPAIYPSLRSSQINLVVAIDTSGSITTDELNEFMVEVDALKSQVRARVTLLACDSKLSENGPWIFEAWDNCRLPSAFEGGGGTDFRPVFCWLEAWDNPPDLLIYFTDAEGEFPPEEPYYPSLWLVKGRAEVPW